MTNETEIYWCKKCETETLAANPTCPKCGRKMLTQSTVKSLGKLLVGSGIILTLISGLGVVVAILVLFLAKLKDKEVATTFVFLVMGGAFTSAGLAAVFGGIRQAKTGRTSKIFSWICLGIVIVIFMLSCLFSAVKG